MGRQTWPSRGPRTNLIANREQQRAVNMPRPLVYGIRRYLDQDYETSISDLMWDLQEEYKIPGQERLEFRNEFSVTLLSRKVIGRQLQRGRVLSMALGKASAAIVRSPDCQYRGRGLEGVKRGRVRMAHGRVLYTTVECPVIEAESQAIMSALDNIGVTAYSSKESMPQNHLTLGHVVNGERLAHREIERTIAAVNDRLPREFDVDAWDTYPVQAAQAAGLLSA